MIADMTRDSSARHPPIEIRKLTTDQLDPAVALLACGMRDNPLHVRVFGTRPDLRCRRLHVFLGPLTAYVHSNGDLLGAYIGRELVGVLGMIRPGRCRPAPGTRLRLGLALAARMPPPVLLRIHRWISAWAASDPAEPHWHIGPLAVLPEYRRRGVGRRLMAECCQRLDTLDAAAWLETDLATNVEFYQQFGFVVAGQEPVLGVTNWFMGRAPRQP